MVGEVVVSLGKSELSSNEVSRSLYNVSFESGMPSLEVFVLVCAVIDNPVSIQEGLCRGKVLHVSL